MLAAGRLNQRITIESPSASVDSLGQPVVGWQVVAMVWASIRHQSGAEAIKADAPISAVKASIRIRYRTGLDASMRVLHGATIYHIKAVLPDLARREYVDLVCEVAE